MERKKERKKEKKERNGTILNLPSQQQVSRHLWFVRSKSTDV